MRVLVVEDHAELAGSVARVLRRDGIAADVAADGEEALRRAGVVDYDVVVLDRDLPRLHGDEVCRALVARGGETKVLMLTASGTIAERVEGLNIGADDYLSKPFAFAELLAQLRVLLRPGQPERETVLRAGALEVDLLARRAARGGEEIPLTQREFEVLEYLLRHRGQTVTREMLGRDVWMAWVALAGHPG